MGNCLRSHVKIVQIVKPDGKILEYKASIRVNEVLSEYQGHGLSEKLPILQYLKPNIELIAGRMYYLTPLPTQQPPKAGKKKVRFAEPEKADEMMTENASLRDDRKRENTSLTVKLVISKQELKQMLENGVFPLDELLSKKQKDDMSTAETAAALDVQSSESKIWMPALRSIPELD